MPLRSTSPSTLSNRLVNARAKYDAQRAAILDQAVARQTVVRETITDLQDESAALSNVIEDAKSS